MKTKDVKVGMKFAAMDGCQFEVVRVHRDEMQVLWFGGNGEEAAPCDHNKVFPVRGPDSEFTLWTSSSTPCTLLNPEQFQEPAVTQTKPLPKFKHTVEITTTRTADDLERSLTGDAYTAKVVKSEQIKEAKFKTGTKIKTSLGYSAEVMGFHNGMYWLRDFPEGPYRSVNDFALDDAEEVK